MGTGGKMLYEVAIIQKPTKAEAEEGKSETLILKPTPVLAKDDKAAGISAVLENKADIECDMSRVEVLVRPFV